MPYVPDATQITEPTDLEKASTMGLEFRTLKSYIQSVIVASLAAKVSTSGTPTFPTTPALSGLLAGDGSTFTYDTNKIIANYGLSWKTLSGVVAGPVAILSGYGGIYFGLNGSFPAALDNVGNFTTTGTSRAAIAYGDTKVRAGTAGSTGSVDLAVGNATNTGYVEFVKPDNTRKAFIGYGLVGIGNPIQFNSDDASKWQFNTNVIAPAFEGVASSALSVPWSGVTGVPALGGTNGSGARTVSTAAPSGGVDGDIWYQI